MNLNLIFFTSFCLITMSSLSPATASKETTARTTTTTTTETKPESESDNESTTTKATATRPTITRRTTIPRRTTTTTMAATEIPKKATAAEAKKASRTGKETRTGTGSESETDTDTETGTDTGSSSAAEFDNDKRVASSKPVKGPLYPYIASVAKKPKSSVNMPKHVCGGVFIREDIVITSAHCVADFTKNLSDYFVLPNYRNSMAAQKGDKFYSVIQVILYPHYEYDPSVKLVKDDIAIVKLKEKIVQSKNVAVIDFAKTDYNPGTVGSLAGYGATELGVVSVSLREAQIEIKDDGFCTIQNRLYVPQTMICATNAVNSLACEFDSGSPLVEKHPNPMDDLLIGIASTEDPCSMIDVKKPTIFVNIAHYATWIESKIDPSPM